MSGVSQNISGVLLFLSNAFLNVTGSTLNISLSTTSSGTQVAGVCSFIEGPVTFLNTKANVTILNWNGNSAGILQQVNYATSSTISITNLTLNATMSSNLTVGLMVGIHYQGSLTIANCVVSGVLNGLTTQDSGTFVGTTNANASVTFTGSSSSVTGTFCDCPCGSENCPIITGCAVASKTVNVVSYLMNSSGYITNYSVNALFCYSLNNMEFN